jgi:hypothetical protein
VTFDIRLNEKPQCVATLPDDLASVPALKERLGGGPKDRPLREVSDGYLNLVYLVNGPEDLVCTKAVRRSCRPGRGGIGTGALRRRDWVRGCRHDPIDYWLFSFRRDGDDRRSRPQGSLEEGALSLARTFLLEPERFATIADVIDEAPRRRRAPGSRLAPK